MESNRPVDLADVLKASKLPTQLPPGMARGVDLAAVRDKKKHQHRWCAMVRYLITDDQMTMVQEQVDAANALAEAQKKAGLPAHPVPINVPLEHLNEVQGPGCLKCNSHFTDPQHGNGKLCDKSDDEFPGLADLFDTLALPSNVEIRAVDDPDA